MKRTTDQINAEINKIFQKHRIKPHEGDEEFWNAVELVKSVRDRGKLRQLAREWDHSQKFSQ